jgi:hypothetical protein
MAKSHSTNTAFSLSHVQKRKPIGVVPIPRHLNPGPRTYATWGDGNCLEPRIHHGDTVVCDPDQTPEAGDIVAIWWKDGARQPLIKVLTLGLPEKAHWSLGGDVAFLLVCEQLNPPKKYAFKLSDVEAVHKVIHHMPSETNTQVVQKECANG